MPSALTPLQRRVLTWLRDNSHQAAGAPPLLWHLTQALPDVRRSTLSEVVRRLAVRGLLSLQVSSAGVIRAIRLTEGGADDLRNSAE